MYKYTICLMLFFTIIRTLAADTIPGGDVSGTWYAANSPYYISGNITIQASDTLTIEPGVIVDFLGSFYYLTVNGLLKAVGTDTDSIFFTADTHWMGLYFNSAPDTSSLEYCVLEKANCFVLSPVYCGSSNPIISHCRISNNTGLSEGGAITLYNSTAEISYCDIIGNTGAFGGGIRCSGGSTPNISHSTISGSSIGAGIYGGGIRIDGGSHPVIDSCIISGNTAVRGGGIAILDGSSCTIIGCIIDSNTTYFPGLNADGGGIYVMSSGGSLTISGSTISHCISDWYGGAICIQSAASVSATRCILDANQAMDLGGAIYSADCSDLLIDHCNVMNGSAMAVSGIVLDGATDLTVTNCIFRSQNDLDIYFMTYTSASVSYSDFYDWGGGGGPFGGNPPAGLGTLVQTNYNGDSCDVFYNIYLDPLFEDFPSGNYHLTEFSPCIDAGDPSDPYDPDSTITDMGVFWYDQTGIVEHRVVKHVNEHDHLGATIFSGPLLLPEGITYKVLDITGRAVEPDKITRGIYFIKVDGKITQKVVKIR
jgi:parallel beta-helix repeat protein